MMSNYWEDFFFFLQYVNLFSEFKLILATMMHLQLQNDLKYVPKNVFTQLITEADSQVCLLNIFKCLNLVHITF